MFTDARFLAARVRIDPKATQAVLPFGLRVVNPATATLFLAHYPQTSFGSTYREAGLFVDVRHPLGRAVHCPWMLVDDDIALIAGRELLGYPKKLGDIDVDFDANTVKGAVSRRGVELLRMRASLSESDPDPPPMLARRAINVWGALGLTVPRLVTFIPKERVLEARCADVTIDVARAERDPLHLFGIGAVLSAHYLRVNIGAGTFPVPVAPVSPLFWVRTMMLRLQ